MNNFDNTSTTTNSGKNNLRRIIDSSNLNKEKSSYELNEQENRGVHNNGKLLRYLSANYKYEVIKLDDFDMSIRIHIPIDYLKNEYNKNISSYGLILYNKYPLMSPNNKNFSEKIISLRMFDKDFNKIEISNLTTPIDIFIKKPFKEFDNCIFFDSLKSFWGVEGCKSVDLGDIMLCSCTHLTDFSLSKYNPTILLRDMANLITDAWIINELKIFKNLKFNNAQVIYIFLLITVVYLFGLLFTLKYDRKDSNDNYIYEVNRISYCCSKKETLENINEIKEITDKAEEERKIRALKYLESRMQTLNLNQKVLKTFGINLQLDNSENPNQDGKEVNEPAEDNDQANSRTRKTFREGFSSRYLKKGLNKNNSNANTTAQTSEENEQTENKNLEEKEKRNFTKNKIVYEKKKSIMIKDIEMQTIVAPGSSMFNNIDEALEDEFDCNSNGEEINNENNQIEENENKFKNEEEEEGKSDLKINSFKKKLFSFKPKTKNEKQEKSEDDNDSLIKEKEKEKENQDESESGKANLRSGTKKSNLFSKSFKKSQKHTKKISFDVEDKSENNNFAATEEVNNETNKKELLILSNDSNDKNQEFSLIKNNDTNAAKNENDESENHGFEQICVDNKINEGPKSKLDIFSKSSFTKILIDGLKVKLQNKLVNHDEFIFKMYKQNENEEIKKDILKYFVIKQSNSKKKKIIQNFKNGISKKLLEKQAKNNDDNKAKDDLEKSNDLVTNILSSVTDNEKFNFKNLNSKNNKTNCLCLETTEDTGNSSLHTKEETDIGISVLIKKENQNELDNDNENENDEEFSLSKIELKNRLLFKYFNLLRFFFFSEYRLISLFVAQFNTFTKTSFLTILIFRLYCALSVCAILSPTMETEDKSTKVIIVIICNLF